MCPSIIKGTLQYSKGDWKIKINKLNYLIIKNYNIQNFILLLNPDFMDTGFALFGGKKKSLLGKLLR